MFLKVSLAVAAAFSLCAAPAAYAGENVSSETTAAQQTDADQKIKCRKVQFTGSLVRKAKVCRTVAEWRRIQQRGSDDARAIVGESICSGGECNGS